VPRQRSAVKSKKEPPTLRNRADPSVPKKAAEMTASRPAWRFHEQLNLIDVPLSRRSEAAA
jgi:hypothetical protein